MQFCSFAHEGLCTLAQDCGVFACAVVAVYAPYRFRLVLQGYQDMCRARP